MSGLTPEQIDLFAMAVCNWWESGELAAFPESPTHLTTEDSIPCSACRAEAEGLAPVVAALIAEAVEEARAAAWADAADLADGVIVSWMGVPGLHPTAPEPHPAAIAAAGARRTLVVLRSRVAEAFSERGEVSP